MESDSKQLILVAGVEGSGKSTFAKIFQNSFLRSLPNLSLLEGLRNEESFYLETDLSNPQEFDLLDKAKALGYKITVFYLFTGKLLSSQRAKLRGLYSGISFDEGAFRKTYEASYKGLGSLYDYADLIFFLKNQKQILFLAAYEPKTTQKEDYLAALEKLRFDVDLFR